MDSLGDVWCIRIMVLLRRDKGFKQIAFSSILFSAAEFGTFSLITQQPKELWTNGGHSRIQRIK